MWSPNSSKQQGGFASSQDHEGDSWEVRAFAEDTGSVMGTTWPPRSYTCTFCRREFPSAQALGGHMNVHRRDRARLYQALPSSATTNSTNNSSTLLIPTDEFVANGGICVLYPMPNPNGVFTSTNSTPINANGCIENPSTLLSISPYPPPNNHHLISPTLPQPPLVSFPVSQQMGSQYSTYRHSGHEAAEPSSNDNKNGKKEAAIEELDLELRLGHRQSP
ncbi:hypothetical protein RJ641_000904 [Dillenia turbinata]|uniref:C2H2-type domain-containing protein n=1 Tax=Dillenia turbinata TaxID=194707 RepID=A0AAN8ZRI4_9MAGN